jgi:hypothetical protein
MSWGIDASLMELTQKLVDTRLRVERIRLAQRLQALEASAENFGVQATDLRDLRKKLGQATALAPDRVDRFLVLPRKPAGVWRRKYLTVHAKPGSVF